ncbi:HEAT repeat-containing protein [Asanoa hainanensis]|uniref:HEAT repeat-containing protein n=2 Tax=Asanoa hainanensis TaxID=560556 RepID=A0A239P6K3_9ACTN|nr:HEAT repeat-containing protein [Asanoa hainanensis]
MPRVIRGVAAGSEEELDELTNLVWHQGMSTDATTAAIPFLVETLDSPRVDRVAVLGLLARIAVGSYHSPFQPEGDQQHAVVCAGRPVFLRLLQEDPGPEVRRAAAQTIGLLFADDPDAAGTTARLRRAAKSDPSDEVRADAVIALGDLGVPVDGFLADPADLVRLAAALVLVSTRADDAVVAVIEGTRPEAIPWVKSRPGVGRLPFLWLLGCVEPHWDVQVRLVTSWLGHPDFRVRASAAHAAIAPMSAWRPAPAKLAPALAAALSDSSEIVRFAAACSLAAAGVGPISSAADELWATVLGGGGAATWALIALARIRDPRADTYLAERLSGPGEADLGDLKHAVDALGSWAIACAAVIGGTIERTDDQHERIIMLGAAGRMKSPDLLPMLRREIVRQTRFAVRPVGKLGPAAAPALAELTALRDTARDEVDRLNAAWAIWRITGDTQQLIEVARVDLENARALDALADVETAAADLAPSLVPLFDGSRYESLPVPERNGIARNAAIAYWYLTGNAEPVVPFLASQLERGQGDLAVARCLAEIGPAAAAVLPQLRRIVADEERTFRAMDDETAVFHDDLFVHTCREAVARISG